MGAFFDATLMGLHQRLADGRDNLRRQLRDLPPHETGYRADAEAAARLFETLIAALPRMPGEETRGPAPEAHPLPPEGRAAAAAAPGNLTQRGAPRRSPAAGRRGL